ncbi:hypothetical protein WMF38_09300 [Sorangium sp. So ce118]
MQPLGLEGEQGARRVAPPLELCAEQAGRGEHVFLRTRVGDGLASSGKPIGAESSKALLEDDFGDMCPGKASLEGRAAAPPDRALHDTGAVDAQVDVLIAAVEPQREAGRWLDGVEATVKRLP